MNPLFPLLAATLFTAAPDPARMVTVKVHLLELSDIRSKEQEFDVELYLYQSWRDPTLAHGEASKDVKAEGQWTPTVEFVQAREVKREGDEVLTVAGDGTVSYVQHVWLTLSTELDLHEFPHDRHILPIQMESFSHGVEELVFASAESAVVNDGMRVAAGWLLDSVQAKVVEQNYPLEQATYSRFRAEIGVHRDADFYLWKIVLPMILIIAMSWSVFWMDPNELEAQMGVAVTSMLAVVAFNFAIADTLPPISYVTRMDVFINFGYVFVFGAFIENMVGHWYVRRDNWAMADRIDRWCRILFPAAYLLQLALFLVP